MRVMMYRARARARGAWGVAITLWVASVAHAGCPPLPGDVNADGKRDATDVMCVALASSVDWNYLVAAPLACMVGGVALADVDCDQAITSTDVALVKDLVMGAGLPPELDMNGNQCVDACEFGCDCAFNEECGPGELCYAAVSGCGSTHGLQAGSAWPTAGYCGGRRYMTPFAGPTEPILGWVTDLGAGAQLEHLALGADGTIYLADSRGALHALSAEGTHQWTAELGALSAGPLVGGVTAPLVAADGRVLVGVTDAGMGRCELCAVSAVGSLLWCVQGAGCASELAPTHGGHLLGGSLWPATISRTTPTGTPQWEVPWSSSLWRAAPVVTQAGRALFYATAPDPGPYGLSMVDPQGGGVMWAQAARLEGGTGMTTGPDGTLYGLLSTSAAYGDGAPKLLALSPEGLTRWVAELPAKGTHTPVVAEDHSLRMVTEDATLLALDPGGALRWEIDLTPAEEGEVECVRRLAQPVLDRAGTTYVAARTSCAGKDEGVLAAVREDGAPLWAYPLAPATDRAHPVMTSEGVLLVVGADRRRLYALR